MENPSFPTLPDGKTDFVRTGGNDAAAASGNSAGTAPLQPTGGEPVSAGCPAGFTAGADSGSSTQHAHQTGQVPAAASSLADAHALVILTVRGLRKRIQYGYDYRVNGTTYSAASLNTYLDGLSLWYGQDADGVRLGMLKNVTVRFWGTIDDFAPLEQLVPARQDFIGPWFTDWVQDRLGNYNYRTTTGQPLSEGDLRRFVDYTVKTYGLQARRDVEHVLRNLEVELEVDEQAGWYPLTMLPRRKKLPPPVRGPEDVL